MINYVIATYFGLRQFPDARYAQDQQAFLRAQLQRISMLESGSLGQITVVLSEDSPRAIALPSAVNNVPVRLICRANIGYSYGAFVDGVDTRFEHHIFMEDDYTFTQPSFDKCLLALLRQEQAEFLCAAVYTSEGDPMPHAGISLGITTTKALLAAIPRMELLLQPSTYAIGGHNQKQFSWGFVRAGFSLVDWLHVHPSAYWDSRTRCVHWFERQSRGVGHVQGASFLQPAFVAPLQALEEKNVRVSDHKHWYSASISGDGALQDVKREPSAATT